MQEMWQPGELDRPVVRMVSLEEILVGKVLAFLDRSAARDAWDLANLTALARETAASSRFRSWFIALSAILDHPDDKAERGTAIRLRSRLPKLRMKKSDACWPDPIREASGVQTHNRYDRL